MRAFHPEDNTSLRRRRRPQNILYKLAADRRATGGAAGARALINRMQEYEQQRDAVVATMVPVMDDSPESEDSSLVWKFYKNEAEMCTVLTGFPPAFIRDLVTDINALGVRRRGKYQNSIYMIPSLSC